MHVQAQDTLGNESEIQTGTDGIVVSATTFSLGKLAAGDSYSCVLMSDGTVQCWGYQDEGRLGNRANNSQSRRWPTNVSAVSGSDNLSGVIQISAGDDFACALTQEGQVLCWGNAERGKLGNGDTVGAQTRPVEVSGLNDAVQISSRRNHSCALTEDGTVKCWGAGSVGVLGNGDTAIQSTL